MPASPIVQMLMLLGLAANGFALAMGGRVERITVAMIVVNLLLGRLGGLMFASGDEAMFRLANDGLAAFAFLAVTLRYTSLWLGAVMLFYAGQFTLHSIYFVTDRPPDYLHAVANNVVFGGIHICLILGTLATWRGRVRARRRRHAAQIRAAESSRG